MSTTLIHCHRSLVRQSFRQFDVVRFLATRATPEVNLESLTSNDCEGILLMSLDRPSAKNALSKNMAQQMLNRLNEVHSSFPQARVLILRSLVPGIFCGGADLKERMAMRQEEVEPLVDQLRLIGQKLAEIPFPTIAALDGHALGGGLEMALACDLRVATENSKMGLVETRLAIIPAAGGSQRLPRLIGISKAKQLIYLAQVLDGVEAEKIGLINRVVNQNSTGNAAFQASLELAKQMLQMGPKALRMAKLAIDQGTQVTLNTGLSMEKAAYAQLIPTQDRLEGLKAFIEKRKPKYTGS